MSAKPCYSAVFRDSGTLLGSVGGPPLGTALILFLQGIWCVMFFYTGRSTVTGATLSFHIHHDRI